MKQGAIEKKETNSELSDVNSNADAMSPKSSFITTSDVLKQLNRQLSDLSVYDGIGSNCQEQKPRFELQKRLPDGSTIPATKDEIAAADFKTKLEQSAKLISQLESSEDRQYWAEQQRLTGNAFFQQGNYKGAMDIYLTCLVVKENTPDFVRDTFLPVLNNLAQCTLQLGMHMKTILFCEMALEEASKGKEKVAKAKSNQEEKKIEETHEYKSFLLQRDLADAIALCKIFFKLAKALRLTGHYRKAREALDSSLDCLTGEENEISASSYTTSGEANDVQFSLVPYKKAIDKEYRYLDFAEKEARRNLARQKRAMRTVLSPSPTAKFNLSATQDKNEIQEESLYEKSLEPRQFSKLRARKFETSSLVLQQNEDAIAYNDGDAEKTSYSHYYWSMVARVAKALLVMLGDDTDNDNEKVPKPNSEDARRGKKRL